MMMVTDFHSHILPGVDDGSASMEESIALLRLTAEQGIRRIVATPHFYAKHDSAEKFLKLRAASYRALKKEAAKHEGLPEIILGAEVYYFRGMSDSEVLEDLAIEGTRCILVEMPMSPWTEEMYQEIEDILNKRRLIPIIAHVDRYIRPIRTFGIPERLTRMPVLIQANATFFLERRTRKMALKMLEKKQIHLLGSDCHNLRHRKPNLGEAVQIIREKLGGIKIREITTRENKVF